MIRPLPPEVTPAEFVLEVYDVSEKDSSLIGRIRTNPLEPSTSFEKAAPSWDSWFHGLKVTDDFMDSRDQALD